MHQPDLLFHKYDMHGLMETHRKKAEELVVNFAESVILSVPTDDLVSQVLHQYRLNVPTLHRDRASVDSKPAKIDFHDRFNRSKGPIKIDGFVVELSVPFTGDKDLFYVQPTTYDSMPPRASITQGTIILTHSARELNGPQIKGGFDSTLDDVERYLGWLRGSAHPFNQNLEQRITKAIEHRKNSVLAAQNTVASLGYNLKPRPNAPQTYVAPVQRKTIPTRPSNSSAPFKPEPALDEAQYKHILSVIENMTHVMERSPTAFANMGEEDIRQHFLVQLNGQFEGQATGETFNYQGKTDILIRVDGRNVFIAECKFWHGEKGYLETIDQILGYLSWRDTKAALIVFNRNKDFSAVLASIKSATDKHPHKKRGLTEEGETRFRFIFGNPSDHNRQITLTVMAFDVPRP